MQDNPAIADIITPDKVNKILLEGILREQFDDVRRPSQNPFVFIVHAAGVPIRVNFPPMHPIALLSGSIYCRNDRQKVVSHMMLVELVLAANRRISHLSFAAEGCKGVSYRHCMSYAWGFSPSYLTFLIRHTATIGGLIAQQCDEHGVLDHASSSRQTDP